MAERELRRMNRTELIEIIYALKQSEDSLKAEKAALEAKLQERTIRIANAGSIAQAALDLNKVFEAAQAAADEYLQSVRSMEQTSDAAQAEQVLADARAEAAQLRAQTEKECAEMKARAEQEIRARWEEFDRRAQKALDSCQNTIENLPSEGK